MDDRDVELTAEAVMRDLGTRVIGRNVLYYPSLGSTMDTARDAAQKGAAEGTVVIAGEQTAGRGRLKRSWLAPEGNIALSVILFPRVNQLPEMIMLASLAVTGSIERTVGIRPEIKWPNDVLIKGRKVCGILIETDARSSDREHVLYVNLGIGINVNLRPDQYKDIEATATSLSIESGRDIAKLAVVRSLLTEMDRLYAELTTGNSLFESWRDRLVTLGRPVTVTSPDKTFNATAESVNRDGSLMVRCQDGELRKVLAGDVTLR